MEKCIVYKIQISGLSKVYIGCSKEFNRRKYIHINDAKTGHNSLLSKSIRKFGLSNVEFIELSCFNSKELALKEERRLTHLIGLENLLNTVHGGGHWGLDFRDADYIRLYNLWKSHGTQGLLDCKPYEEFGRLKNLFRQGYGSREDLNLLLKEREIIRSKMLNKLITRDWDILYPAWKLNGLDGVLNCSIRDIPKERLVVRFAELMKEFKLGSLEELKILTKARNARTLSNSEIIRRSNFKLLMDIWSTKGIKELMLFEYNGCPPPRAYYSLTYLIKLGYGTDDDLKKLKLEYKNI